MNFGNWELREDSSYYLSSSAIIWPSSNAVDEGKLTTEENLRNVYRDIINKNYVLKYNYFSLKVNATRTAVIVSPGEAVIQGYHFIAKNSVEVKVPDNRTLNNDGTYNPGPIIQYTLGISLSYDAANHVTGDIVNKEAEIGEAESLSGVYLKWFNECELECNYDNILVLGRAWVQAGAIISDGTTVYDENNSKRIIYHGFEQDPFKDHRLISDVVELTVYGHKTTMYDTLRDNMTQIHTPLYTYDSMHFPIELDRQDRTKPPTFVTDIQDYVNHIPDWYTSKYGDYMTGALRFNNLSIDAMREFNKDNIDEKNPFIKDSVNNKFTDSVFISPRTYGNLTRTISDYAGGNEPAYDYNVGGTIMSIVPHSYSNSTDNNDGYTGIHSALLAQKYGDTGLRIHCGDGNENSKNNYTRLVHYNETDTGLIYDKDDTSALNTSKFIIENVDENDRKVSINFKNGELFIDSFTSPMINDTILETKITNSGFSGYHNGSGIQFFTSSNKSKRGRNIDFRIDEYDLSIAQHDYECHRTASRGNVHTGSKDDTLHFKMGLGMPYIGKIEADDTECLSDAYMYMDNLLIKSNKTPVESNSGKLAKVKQNTIEVFNTGDDTNGHLNYIRILPRVYSKQYLAEESIQVGTHVEDNYYNDEAENNTLNKIIMKRIGPNTYENANVNITNPYTYLEQSYRYSYDENNFSRVINKWMQPMIDTDERESDGSNKGALIPRYDEIAGMYSAGNIGCSNKALIPGNGVSSYTDDTEWVRFTRFRYDIDKDTINGGSNGGNNEVAHNSINGRKWGATYNIEFNTNVANERANQIIWRFNGSKGKQTDISLENTPPVVLSYIHDSINEGDTATKYTDNNGIKTYEEWIDHNGITQHNPTYKIRDFLHLENAGLCVHGDINNPSWGKDSLNTNNRLGTTILMGRVYNAVYNDFAETFEKNDKSDKVKPGTLISLNYETGKYEVCDKFEDRLIVGVTSNTYAFLAGGNRVDGTQDIIDLENEYYTVALCGKVWVRVVNNCIDGDIKPGDLLTSSSEKGKACKSRYLTSGTIIGKALSEPKYFNEEDEYKVLMLVATS